MHRSGCCRTVCKQRMASLLAGLSLFTYVAAGELSEGVVLSQTVTVAGQDFYQGFVALWRDKPISERYLLVVRERPSARTGSVVWIECGGRRLLQLALPVSRSMIRRISEQAVEDTWQRLTEAEIEARIDGDRDLAQDEL